MNNETLLIILSAIAIILLCKDNYFHHLVKNKKGMESIEYVILTVMVIGIIAVVLIFGDDLMAIFTDRTHEAIDTLQAPTP